MNNEMLRSLLGCWFLLTSALGAKQFGRISPTQYILTPQEIKNFHEMSQNVQEVSGKYNNFLGNSRNVLKVQENV